MTSPRSSSTNEGLQSTPPSVYGLQGDDGDSESDSFHETRLDVNRDDTSPYGAGVPYRVQHSVYHSRRAGRLSRWHTTFPDTSATTHTWLRRVDYGQGLIPNERWFEDFQLPTEVQHNPTMGGTLLQPPGSPITRLSINPVVWFRTHSGGSSARTEGCGIPMDYDSFGLVEASDDRGGDHENHILWPRVRQWESVDVCYGHGRIHRVRHWFYFPRPWTGQTGRWLGWTLGGAELTDYFGTTYTAEFYDPVRKVATDLGAEWTGSTSQSWRITGDRANPGLDLFTTITRTDPYPFVSDYVSAILPGRNAGQDVCIATYGKVFRGEDDAGRGCQRPSRLLLLQERNAPFTVGEDIINGQLFAWYTPSPHRVAGWCGIQYYIITAETRADARALVDLAHSRRLADEPVVFDVPAEVIGGMDPAFENRYGPRGGLYLP